jgi:hypothetical protein
MTNAALQLKIKQRLNKLASNDYDNIECWQIVEAFNKAQVEWVRRQLHGNNLFKEGDEGSKRRVDDLQLLLLEIKLLGNNKKKFFESRTLPSNYLQYKRVNAYAKSECCPERGITVYLAEEANAELLLRDMYRQPSFEWGETFCTLIGDKIRIYTDSKFTLSDASFTYYRQPRRIEILNCVDPYTGVLSLQEIICEFKDDIVELLIDEAASILAGDIESQNQFQRGTQSAERNN